MSKISRYKQKPSRIYPPSPIPGKILDYLQENPGARLYKLVEAADASRGAVTYHLTALIANGQIIADKQTTATYYYLQSQNRREEETVLQQMMKNETKYQIIFCLLKTPGLSRGGIAAAIEKKEGTLHRHLKTLQEAGIINRIRDGHAWRYVLSKDVERTITTLNEKQQSF